MGRGGIGAAYDAADWDRALRHGVDRSGRGLLFMPVDHYQHLSDEDLGAMIAYYRSLPPVDNDRTALELSLLARLMIDLGLSGPVVAQRSSTIRRRERRRRTTQARTWSRSVAAPSVTVTRWRAARGSSRGHLPGRP